MKLSIKKSLLSLGAAMLLLGSCKKGFDDFGNLNTNPNATSTPVTSALLTNVESQLGANVWGNAYTINGALYAQYVSETQYTDASRYATPTTNEDGWYAGPLYDLQNIINVNSDPETADYAALNGSNANQIATARILKAYYFWLLTDAWGDIPYFDALQSKSDVAYDPQSEIYPDLLKELKEAVAQFDAGPTFNGDILFDGDIASWKMFANSIRALIALRMSEVDPATGKTEFAAAIAAGVIESNADNASLAYPGDNYRNPIYDYYNVTKRFDYAISKTMTDFLTAHNDPRIALYGSSSKGFPYGLTRDDAIAWSDANADFGFLLGFTATPADMPFEIITAGQMDLARAEAASLGWTAESAPAFFASGITKEMNRWGITNTSAIATYVAQFGVPTYQDIVEQRWLAHYPDGNQAWAIWRKTGYPVLSPAPGSGKQIPLRLPYGPNDIAYNPQFYADAAARYTVAGVANSQDAPVWWDK